MSFFTFSRAMSRHFFANSSVCAAFPFFTLFISLINASLKFEAAGSFLSSFADKAVEAAEIGEEKLDPSLACRLLGNTLLGKASIYVRESLWKEAAETYYRGAEAYSRCNDYLMQSEALRLCGWCRENNYEKSLAAECYVEGFRLSDKLSIDLIKNSSYPLLLLSLLNSSARSKLVSDDEINEVLTKVLGDDWENYLYEYKRNLGKYNGMAEQHIAKS